MIRPLDLQLAWNVIPKQAQQIVGEQASHVYRTMQDLNEAIQKSRNFSQGVVSINGSESGFFHSLAKNMDTFLKQNPSQTKTAKKTKSKRDFDLYSPKELKIRRGVAEFLDIKA